MNLSIEYLQSTTLLLLVTLALSEIYRSHSAVSLCAYFRLAIHQALVLSERFLDPRLREDDTRCCFNFLGMNLIADYEPNKRFDRSYVRQFRKSVKKWQKIKNKSQAIVI